MLIAEDLLLLMTNDDSGLAKHQGKKPSAVVTPLSKGVRELLYQRLVTRGILRSGQGRILGIFPTQSWPTEELEHERAVREHVVQSAGLDKKRAQARAQQVAEGDWGFRAVRQALDEMMAAVMVATTVATTAAVSSS